MFLSLPWTSFCSADKPSLLSALLVCLTCLSSTAYGVPNGPESSILFSNKPWQGDLDGMVERQVIRALVVYNKTQYFLDGPDQRGISYESLKLFEQHLNNRLGKKILKIDIFFIPVPRQNLIPMLESGYGDLAVANLTITPERQQRVDFSQPLLSGVKEVLVSGPSAPPVANLEALGGLEVHARKSSSYYEHLQAFNQTLIAKGKPAIILPPVPEEFEDSDLLEMVNAGALPFVFVDRHKARFWADIFDNLSIHEELFFGGEGNIAWAFRKDSPQLKAMVDGFVSENRKGTLTGNIIFKRYLKTNRWIKNPRANKSFQRFEQLTGHFRKYAKTYDFDWLMLAAQGYQESQLDQSRHSPAGAIGIMQLLPSTAADKNVNIPNIAGIENTENNIHAGAKYLRFIRDRYFSDPLIDEANRVLLSFAAYNAGPARVARLRKETAIMGLDPNRWFYNVEVVAAKRIGRETVQYVRNIFKYYVVYRRTLAQRERPAYPQSRSGSQ